MAVTKYKTKAGVRYRAFLFVKSQRVANKAGFLTKREAKQWLRKEEEKWQSPQARAKKTRMDFADLANAYLTEIEDRRKRNTYIFKRGVFRRVLNFFNNRLPLEELDRVLLAGYLRVQKDERGAKAANRDRKELSALFTWGIRHEFLYSNPAQLIEPYAEETYVRYVPSAEDIAAVRVAATKEERQFIDTLYYTAARISEIINLTWEDVNFEAKAVRLWTSKRRGGTVRLA